MRTRHKLRLRRIIELRDGSHLRVYAEADKRGRTTFAHVWGDRYQIFTTNLEEWLAYYGHSIADEEN